AVRGLVWLARCWTLIIPTASRGTQRTRISALSLHDAFRSVDTVDKARGAGLSPCSGLIVGMGETDEQIIEAIESLKAVDSDSIPDRKSTRLNSSHVKISYAVFCLKKKIKQIL